MPEKTSTSSPSSRRPSSDRKAGAEANANKTNGRLPARLICPPELPGLSLCFGRDAAGPQARHAHESLIIGVVTGGVRRITTPLGETRLTAREVFCLRPGLAHTCSEAQAPCSHVALCLEMRALPRDLRVGCGRLPVGLEDPELSRTLLRLAEACEAPAGPLERQSLLAAAIEGLCAHLRPEPPATQRDVETNPELAAAVRRAMEFIETMPGLALPELAQLCGMEPFALHRAFTRLVGLPPHAYETHLRLRRAKALLRQGTALIDAALAAGFCDQSHMHRHFTRLVGLTPALYARAHALRG